METKVALLVLYNHRYEKNIDKIKTLYKDRFRFVYQLIPFYEGNDPSVIPVFGSSFYFQIFLSQAYIYLKQQNFTHYFVVADDMILNPAINENNIFKLMGLTEDDFFISNLQPLQTHKNRLAFMKNAIKYEVKQRGVEVETIIPNKIIAEKKFSEHGFPTGPIPISYFFRFSYRKGLKNFLFDMKDILLDLPLVFRRKLRYPLIKAYSDILLLPQKGMEKFSTYCGAFASTRLFVELAIPTSLLLIANKENLKTCEDIKLKYGAMWSRQAVDSISEKHGYSITNLQNNFPKDKLFLHPIKLSKWSFTTE